MIDIVLPGYGSYWLFHEDNETEKRGSVSSRDNVHLSKDKVVICFVT